MHKRSRQIMFLIGLFSMTEIYIGGFIAISELVLFAYAPFVFLKDFRIIKKDGFMLFIALSILTILGCVVASLYNHTPFPFALKGLSATYGLFAVVVCMHRILRQDFNVVGSFFIGYALSIFINIFMFQRGSMRSGGDFALVSAVAQTSTLSGVLFWADRLPHWLYLPIRSWYTAVPKVYAVSASLCVAAACLFLSGGSGRAATICALGTFAFLCVGGGTVGDLQRLKKHVIVALLFVLGILMLGKMSYQYCAKKGILGESSARKLAVQSRHGEDLLSLLMAGRSEFFAGIYCALKNPILGYGPWAIDKNGVAAGFIYAYGDPEDYESYMRSINGQTRKLPVIPSHSCIVCFWTWYGIFGLVLWLYILMLYLITITKSFVCYVPWFGCVATILPTAVWDALFSPYGNRVMVGLFLTMCLYLKAVYDRKVPVGGFRLYDKARGGWY